MQADKLGGHLVLSGPQRVVEFAFHRAGARQPVPKRALAGSNAALGVGHALRFHDWPVRRLRVRQGGGTSAIRLEHLSKCTGTSHAPDALDLAAIDSLGPNGPSRTTTLHIVAGPGQANSAGDVPRRLADLLPKPHFVIAILKGTHNVDPSGVVHALLVALRALAAQKSATTLDRTLRMHVPRTSFPPAKLLELGRAFSDAMPIAASAGTTTRVSFSSGWHRFASFPRMTLSSSTQCGPSPLPSWPALWPGHTAQLPGMVRVSRERTAERPLRSDTSREVVPSAVAGPRADR